MEDDPLYHDGMRRLQDARETRRLADRLKQTIVHPRFTDDDRAFIQRCAMFFVATADAHGRPDCSYKGGLPGFVRILDDRTLAFPDYDGNGMYRSWGNLLVNPHVGLLFLDFENPKRVAPQPFEPPRPGPRTTFQLPARSYTVIQWGA